MSLTKIIFATILAFSLFANTNVFAAGDYYLEPRPNLGSSQVVEKSDPTNNLEPEQKETLHNFLEQTNDRLSADLQAQMVQIEILKRELEEAKSEGVHALFLKLTGTCTIAAIAIGLFIYATNDRIAPSLTSYIKNRGGRVIASGVFATACASISGTLYSLTNNKVEKQKELLELAIEKLANDVDDFNDEEKQALLDDVRKMK